MTWREVLVWEWICDGDGCTEETAADDDRQPEGWIHTIDGRDLCGECRERAA
ncbi:hypothetical protein ACJ5H2_05875 [Nocardioides sp. R1-1]|uniref:hypothetical protein n=1 Tax=Nocardioides sp. R1-1 TaxID=3383502 RepID=UPI0038CF40FA